MWWELQQVFYFSTVRCLTPYWIWKKINLSLCSPIRSFWTMSCCSYTGQMFDAVKKEVEEKSSCECCGTNWLANENRISFSTQAAELSDWGQGKLIWRMRMFCGEYLILLPYSILTDGSKVIGNVANLFLNGIVTSKFRQFMKVKNWRCKICSRGH